MWRTVVAYPAPAPLVRPIRPAVRTLTPTRKASAYGISPAVPTRSLEGRRVGRRGGRDAGGNAEGGGAGPAVTRARHRPRAGVLLRRRVPRRNRRPHAARLAPECARRA